MSLTEKLFNTQAGWYLLHAVAGLLVALPGLLSGHPALGLFTALAVGVAHEHGDGDLYLTDALGVKHLLTYTGPDGKRLWATNGLVDVATFLPLVLLTGLWLLR